MGRGILVQSQSGTVVYSATVLPGQCYQARGGWLPWNYLGGFLAEMLTEALEEGRRVHVEAAERGYCRLEVHSEGDTVTVAILDPARGYLPVVQALLPPGGMGRWEEIAFRRIDPGVWFPVAVRTRHPHRPKPASVEAVPRLRFSDIRINDPGFDRLLAPELPAGSTVADVVHGVRHVVERKRAWDVPESESSPPHTGGSHIDRGQGAIEDVYRLGAQEVLKRITRPFLPVRGEYILQCEPDVAPALEAELQNAIYVLEWGDGERPTARYAGMGFLSLSEILRRVCGLDIFEYSGPEDVLDLRLTGDWIVRRGASNRGASAVPGAHRVRGNEHANAL